MKKTTERHIRNAVLIFLGVLLLLVGATYFIAQVYRKEILSQVNQSVNEKLKGDLKIEDIDFTLFSHFPSLSLSLKNVSLKDSLYEIHHQELFHAEKILLQLELLKLISGRIDLGDVTIENAQISLLTMKNGYKNFDIVRKDTVQKDNSAKPSSLSASVNKLILNNVRFSMIDSTKDKWFGFQFKKIEQVLHFTDSTVSSTMSGSLYFNGLAFKAEKGSFLTKKDTKVSLLLDFNFKTKKLRIHPSVVQVDQFNFFVNGHFEFSDTSHMHLEILARDITLAEANTILTQHIAQKLSMIQMDHPVKNVIIIDGRLYYGSKPAVDVFFITENNTLSMKTKTFDEVKIYGWFSNHVDSTRINDDHNSRLLLPHFTGNLGGIPLYSKIAITDLQDPHLNMNASVNMNLEDAGELLDTSLFYLEGGRLAVRFRYDGKLVNYVDTVTHQFLGDVSGSVHLTEGHAYYLPRNFEVEHVNTSMTFNDSLLRIDSLQLELNKNPIAVNGIIKRFIPYLFVPGDYLIAELQLNAASLNFDNFKNPIPIAKKTKKQSASSKKIQQNKISAIVGQILNTMEVNMLLTAGEVSSERFKATNVAGEVAVSDEFVKFKNVNMQTSGGTFALNGGVTSLNTPPYRMNINCSIVGADISNLFYSFDNFKQSAITHKNLKGQLTTSVNFNTLLKKDYSIQPSSMNGQVILQVKNGALVDFEPLEVVTKYAFKNRGLDNIEFAKLRDTMTINGQDITFSRMEIQSTAFTLFVEGTYSFVPGKTDLSVQFPLSNLKKRETDYKPENVGIDKKMGASIFLRAYDDSDGKLQIKYDPFKSYYKEKFATDSSTIQYSTEKKEKKKKKDK